MEKWVTPPEFAATYGVSQATVQRCIHNGKVRAVKVSNHYLVHDPELFEKANPRSRVIRNMDLMPVLECGEVSKIIGVTPREVLRLVVSHKLPCTKYGRFRWFSVSDVRTIILYRAQKRRKASGNPVPITRKEAIVEWAEARLKKELEVGFIDR